MKYWEEMVVTVWLVDAVRNSCLLGDPTEVTAGMEDRCSSEQTPVSTHCWAFAISGCSLPAMAAKALAAANTVAKERTLSSWCRLERRSGMVGLTVVL